MVYLEEFLALQEVKDGKFDLNNTITRKHRPTA
jgi:hypothetical protein